VSMNVSNPNVLQVTGEYIGEYRLQMRKVCETAAGFVADSTHAACCRDPDRQEVMMLRRSDDRQVVNRLSCPKAKPNGKVSEMSSTN
jgi:hypothetical protein